MGGRLCRLPTTPGALRALASRPIKIQGRFAGHHSSTTSCLIPTFTQKRSKAVRDAQTLTISLRERTGRHEATRRPWMLQPPSTRTARHSRRAWSATSASRVSCRYAFFISYHLLIVGLSKSTRILRHHHSRRGPAVSNSTCFLRVGLSKRPTECRAARQTRPRPAGTPKVWGMATTSASDFNQERLVCTPLFHISGVIRNPGGCLAVPPRSAHGGAGLDRDQRFAVSRWA